MADGTEPVGSGLRIFVVLALLFAAGAGVWLWRGGLGSGNTVDIETSEADRASPAIDADADAAEQATAPAAGLDAGSDAAEDADVAADAASGAESETAETGSEAPDAQPEAEAETAQDTPATPPATQSPTFDVVRVGPDGSAVIAGRADPGSVVGVELDGATVGEATADGSGGFVAILDLGASDEPRALSLNAGSDGTDTVSEQVVVLAPSAPAEEPEPAGTDTASADPEEGTGEDDAPTETQTADAGADASATQAPAGENTAPSVILADRSGIRILQGSQQPNAASDNVVIDAITYDAEGDVALSGRAAGEGFVRVYVDNAPIETGAVTDGGQWRVDLPDVDTGTYTLRVDQVDAEGQVVSRTETPFQREAPEAIQALAEEQAEDPGQPLVELVTVQPGNTLWGISQRAYGEGTLFVRVFEANRAKITEPDLIYPGQVFSVPN